MDFLTSADDFMASARQDLRTAKVRALVQAMTFEGDAAGEQCAQALEACAAVDRRLLFDAYSLVVVSDRWIINPRHLRSRIVQRERDETLGMMHRLEQGGVSVRVLHPLGKAGVHLPLRNHKKLVLADDVIYLGGINFSDHNFAWRDMMVRLEDAGLARWLAEDFEQAWEGQPTHRVYQSDGLRLDSLAGVGNPARWAFLRDMIDAATERIVVLSPYLTFPFLDWLGEAQKRGVEVTVVSPAGNNKQAVADYLWGECQRLGIALELYPGMSHLKAMRIDDDTLIVGSSNFDFVSYEAQAEYVLTCHARRVCEVFDHDIMDVDRAQAVPCSIRVPTWRARSRKATLRIARSFTRIATHFPPTSWVEDLPRPRSGQSHSSPGSH